MDKADVTLKDIAQVVDKSVATVSKALNNHEDIGLETRSTIKRIAEEMGYRPNITAQRLQKKRVDAIGLILPVFSARQADPFLTELLAGVADKATEQEFDLLVLTCAPGEKEEAIYRRLVNQRRVDGLIVAQPRKQDWRIEFLTEKNVPFVVVGHHSSTLKHPGIWINTSSGIRQIVEHIVKQSKQTVGLIPPPNHLAFSDAYVTAFENALKDHPTLTGQIAEAIKNLSQKAGYRAAQMLLENNMVDAIVACHDLVALGAMSAIQDQGFDVGSDIIIIGFGDILLAEHSNPPLTSVHQPTYDMGQQAGAILIDSIVQQKPMPPPAIIEPWLVVRQSSNLALWL